MNNPVYKASLQDGGLIHAQLKDAYFYDAWSVLAAEPELSALGQFLKAARATPKWVDMLMWLRNSIVRLFGLKDLGGLAEVSQDKAVADYKPGDRVGIFSLLQLAPNKVLLGDNDKHLEVVLSLSQVRQDDGRMLVTITTVVHVHNLLGKLYMLPVTPMHKLIAPAVARAIGRYE